MCDFLWVLSSGWLKTCEELVTRCNSSQTITTHFLKLCAVFQSYMELWVAKCSDWENIQLPCQRWVCCKIHLSGEISENGLDPNFGERKTTWQNVRSLSPRLSFESRATRGIRPLAYFSPKLETKRCLQKELNGVVFVFFLSQLFQLQKWVLRWPKWWQSQPSTREIGLWDTYLIVFWTRSVPNLILEVSFLMTSEWWQNSLARIKIP